MKSIVAASILAADPGFYHDEIVDIEKAGADWIHVDVMDGRFVPPITFGDNVVSAAKRARKLFLDVHIMIEEPQKHIDAFARAGADQLTFHLEATPNPKGVLRDIRSSGMKAGLAIKPKTPAPIVFELLELCDLLLIMTVNPGWGGQAFMFDCLSKVAAVRSAIDERGLQTIVQVDGGINAETGRECFNNGAQSLVAGSFLFKAEDRSQAINQLRFNK